MRQKIECLWLGLWFWILVQSCGGNDKVALLTDPQNVNSMYDLALEPKLFQFQSVSDGHIPANEPPLATNKDMEHLGHALFYENMLSGNRSCNSCHNLNNFGIEDDRFRTTSVGAAKNVPSVLNAALDTIQLWHGNAGLDRHLRLHINQLNNGGGIVMTRFLQDSNYRKMFHRAFPEKRVAITYDNLLYALTEFEKKLKTPSSFDRYLDGDRSALSIQQKRGLLSFINIGCVDCHSGASVGGDLTKKFGVFDEYWKYTQSNHIDDGLYTESRKPKDRYVFSVPSLRNVERTAPYFHDGSKQKLDDAIRIMARIQLDYTLNDNEVDNIEAFLKSLTSDSLPHKYKSAPDLN